LINLMMISQEQLAENMGLLEVFFFLMKQINFWGRDENVSG